jgi:DNA-binding transcriptional LysR family regulator
VRISRRGLIRFLASAPAIAAAAPCCGLITPQGARLAALLDGTGVDHLWLAGDKVDWETGESRGAWNDGKPHTHCSAFVASVAKRLGVYVLRPPDHGAVLLANAQMGWLRSMAAAGAGWRPLPDAAAAQARANEGDLVVAAFENPDPDKPGHIAIVRPSDIDAATLQDQGPFVSQAGGHNALSTPLARGFRNHPGAWRPGGGGSVRFFAHTITWA